MYFFDTYAFIEMVKGNKNYLRFKSSELATSKLNLMEVYCWLLNNFSKEIADLFYDKTVQYVIDISDDAIKEAMMFRIQNKSKNLSYIDCIGYVLAKSSGLKFLTGDRQFRQMDNVEFVQ